MAELLTMGEPLVCLASSQVDMPIEKVTQFRRYIGGAELNVATGMSKLNHQCIYVSQIGADPFGRMVLGHLRKWDIDTTYVRIKENYWTGHQIKELVSKGDPQVYNYRTDTATSHFDTHFMDAIDMSSFKIAHLTGILPGVAPKAREAFDKLYFNLLKNNKVISFDTNIRLSLWEDKTDMRETINRYAKNATIVLPGVGEGKILMGSDDPEEIADFYLQGPKTKLVVVKLGSKGAFFKQKLGQKGYLPGFKVASVKDTVGAGDGFAVGVLSGLLEHLSVKDAVHRGNAIGALQVQAYGDNDGYPTPAQLETFYQQFE